MSEDQAPSKTFAEAKGTEANQHAKKLAREKAAKDKYKKKDYEQVFSQVGTKIVKITIKENGAHQEYVGSIAPKKKEAGVLKDMILKWKKDKVWIGQDALQEYTSKKIEALNK